MTAATELWSLASLTGGVELGALATAGEFATPAPVAVVALTARAGALPAAAGVGDAVGAAAELAGVSTDGVVTGTAMVGDDFVAAACAGGSASAISSRRRRAFARACSRAICVVRNFTRT